VSLRIKNNKKERIKIEKQEGKRIKQRSLESFFLFYFRRSPFCLQDPFVFVNLHIELEYEMWKEKGKHLDQLRVIPWCLLFHKVS